MKIAFVSALDPRYHVDYFSGIPYHLFRALARRVEIVPVPVAAERPPAWYRLYTRLRRRLAGRPDTWGLRPGVLQRLAHGAAAAVAQSGADVALSIGQGCLAFWAGPVPMASFSDVLYGGLNPFPDQQGQPRPLAQAYREQLARIAQRAADNAVRVFITSEFALQGALAFGTRLPREKVVITQIGANFEEWPPAPGPRRPPPPLKLLWVGTGWAGKGGEDCLAVLDALHRAGVEAELSLAGRVPSGLARPHVVYHGFLHKDVPEEQQRLLALYREAHLFLLPTRKDFTPCGLAEAAAMGLPAVTTLVGGIPGMFAADEVVLLDIAHYREQAPAAINQLLQDGRLEEMAGKVRHRFESTLNWDTIAAIIISELERALKR
ncbi:MAG: glycosyltransferase family 4 protein [Chloroflexi bacterium]|nr:glycosyltransferase family 4 protein [Chloroflexota bacterium]MCI0576328.1 glycosyltransferase family 4 protein [Chloroflexota bacterium]MCI0650127.1 glycosyltransferase family 4 protein [Chloroflexota bacterium]MCI0731211.1 glycosyltransferase family 4 protein [Chloroflexota bacterium]